MSNNGNPFEAVDAQEPKENDNSLNEFSATEDYELGDIPADDSALEVRKPTSREIFQASDDPGHRFTGFTLEDELQNLFLVKKTVADKLPSDVRKTTFVMCENTKGETFINPVPAITDRNKDNLWTRSNHKGVSEAMEGPVRMTADMQEGQYKVHRIKREMDKPKWPEQPFTELLLDAFGNRIIEGTDHPAVQELLDGLV